MTLRYLIDTDWAIHYLNGHPQIVQRLKNLRNQGLGISVVSLAELYEGIYYSADPEGSEKGLADLLGELAIVGIDKESGDGGFCTVIFQRGASHFIDRFRRVDSQRSALQF